MDRCNPLLIFKLVSQFPVLHVKRNKSQPTRKSAPVHKGWVSSSWLIPFFVVIKRRVRTVLSNALPLLCTKIVSALNMVVAVGEVVGEVLGGEVLGGGVGGGGSWGNSIYKVITHPCPVCVQEGGGGGGVGGNSIHKVITHTCPNFTF